MNMLYLTLVMGVLKGKIHVLIVKIGWIYIELEGGQEFYNLRELITPITYYY